MQGPNQYYKRTMRQNQNLTFSMTLLKWDCFFVLLILNWFFVSFDLWLTTCLVYLYFLSCVNYWYIQSYVYHYHDTKKEKLTSIRPLVLPTQLSSKKSGTETECDGDDFSTLELGHGSKDRPYNEDVYVVQSIDEELDYVCGDSTSLNGLTKVCWFCTHSLFWLLCT